MLSLEALHAPVGAEAPPYSSSAEHLADELERIDQLLRAAVVRWRVTLAATKPADLWGMIHVTEAEVERYLAAPFLPPGREPDDLGEILEPYRRRAAVLAERNARRRTATLAGVELRLARLETLFGLTPLERDVVLVCLLNELDQRYRRLFAYLADDASRTCPSVELVLGVLGAGMPAAWEAGGSLFAAGAALVEHELVVLDHAGEPLAARLLRLDDRVAAYLQGSDVPDARLAEILAASPAPSAWDRRIAGGTVAEKPSADDGADAVFFFHGPYGSGRRAAARLVAETLGRPLLIADAGQALHGSEPFARTVALAFREATLTDAAITWTGCERLRETATQRWGALVAAAEAWPGTSILISDAPWEPAERFQERQLLRLAFTVPSYGERRQLWRELLPDGIEAGDEDLADALANSFQLTAGQMTDALATARSLAAERRDGDPRPNVEELYEGCRRQSGRLLSSYARRIEPRRGLDFDQLILPPAHHRQFLELRDRIRYRGRILNEMGFERRLSLGRGLVALFTGSSGTGKTMAAELLAGEQGVDLYKIDLSSVVSKYVGETEKNLHQVFAEAESSNALLFFDEADALFGKRGEVKEARDRWANLEVNYLLQRVEEYPGVVILATNLRQNIDQAFLRRVQVIVEFPAPDTTARLAIWRGMFPAGIERPGDAELEGLAERFRLPGGSIKNVVLDAAFRAVAGNGHARPAIDLRHLTLGIGREYQKLGKPITRSEFGEELYGWIAEDLR